MAADTAAAAAASFTVKLLVNTRSQRVLFAETTRDVVYFLYSLRASPDTPIPFDQETWDGCTSNLADSAEELHDLEDHPLPPPSPLLPGRPQQRQDPSRFFVCGDKRGAGCDGYVAERSGARCPSCGGRLDAEAPPGAPGASCSLSEQPAVPPAPADLTFALMDDLSLGPSPVNARMVFTGSVGANALQEATVRLGHEEALAILKASLESSHVLTDVFLCDKAPVVGAWS